MGGVQQTHKVKIIRTPQEDYMKHFAHDSHSVHIGTELERIWTEEDLEAMFRMWQNAGAPRWNMSAKEGKCFIVEDDEWYDENKEYL